MVFKKTYSILCVCVVLLLGIALMMAACDTDTHEQTTDAEETTVMQETETQAHVHAWGSWVIEVEQTCVQDGRKKRSCACGEVETKKTNAYGHEEVLDEGKAPTCTETGLTEGAHCSECKEILVAQEEIAPLGHTEVFREAVEATCTESGLTEGKYCSVCEEVLVEQTVVEALGHTEVVDAAVPATCTESGLTEGKHCSVCTVVLVAQEYVPETGHEFGDWVTETEATCTQTGCKVQSCHCGERIEAEIPRRGHGPVYVYTIVEATCSGPGLVHEICDGCGKLMDSRTVERLKHNRTLISASLGTGTVTFDCADCRKTITEPYLPLTATIMTTGMGGGGGGTCIYSWSVKSENGAGYHQYSFSIWDQSRRICLYSSAKQTNNDIEWVSSYMPQDLRENPVFIQVTIYDDIGEMTYEFKANGGFSSIVNAVVIKEYTAKPNNPPIKAVFYTTGLSSGASGLHLNMEVDAVGGNGNYRYQLLVYNYDFSPLYDGGIQTSNKLAWKSNYQWSHQFDDKILMVKIYDDYGYATYAAMLHYEDLHRIESYEYEPYKVTG